jgi:oligopeptide/dipeptide ABC transporter ATP-binding protein
MSETVEQLDEVATGETLLEIENLSKYFSTGSGMLSGFFDSDDVEAVDDVTLELKKGETLALVGESGCGKSTLARAILQLIEPTDGSVRFKGTDLTELSGREIRPLRRDMQMIFQDPQSSLNPRMKVGQIIEEPMKAHGLYDKSGRRERARELLELVELKAEYYNRYPHEFSGGQRQRINLARAMSTDPELIMCDEPVSALDVSVQAQVLNTMRELQAEFGFTYLMISHDLSAVRYIADRVAVMYLGHIVELAEKEELYENPKHPYTQALLDAIPIPDPRSRDARATLEGDVPSPINPPSGCRFRTRCPKLIAPEEFELTETEWSQTLAFVRGVQRRTFAIKGADSTVEDGDAELPQSTVESEIDARFFPEGRPADVDEVVEDVCASIADGDWDDAREIVTARFEDASVCALERPQYTVASEHGTGDHFVGCHLHKN